MPEAHALALHRPVDGTAADATAEAVPKVLGRRHHQARGVVLVEGAAALPVLSARQPSLRGVCTFPSGPGMPGNPPPVQADQIE